MEKRSVIRMVLDGEQPPYVPWSFGFTKEARATLQAHFGLVELEDVLQNHLLRLGNDIGFFTDLGRGCVQDVFGVVWDRSVDKDIGNVEGTVLPEPTLTGYRFPSPDNPALYQRVPSQLAKHGDCFRVFPI